MVVVAVSRCTAPVRRKICFPRARDEEYCETYREDKYIYILALYYKH